VLDVNKRYAIISITNISVENTNFSIQIQVANSNQQYFQNTPCNTLVYC